MKTFDDILGAKPINKWGLDFQLYWINVVFSKLASQSEAVFIPRQAFKTITEILKMDHFQRSIHSFL